MLRDGSSSRSKPIYRELLTRRRCPSSARREYIPCPGCETLSIMVDLETAITAIIACALAPDLRRRRRLRERGTE